jgi:tricorn protease
MKTFLNFILALICLVPLFSNASLQQNTKLLSQPALSDTHIAFIYAEDLWIANKDGSNPIRLTIDEGIESNPIFSPDGSMIAFNAQYDGNSDVFVIPVTGGVPKRLTWHPYNDFVRDFSADGKTVLFLSRRNTHTNRHAQLHTISVNGGSTTQLPIPHASWASYSENNKSIAYTTLFDAFTQWKHYRGGRTSRIWIYDTNTYKVVEIPKPTGGSNDSQPQWMGDHVYFKSDRDGEFNLYRYSTISKDVERLTNYKNFPVANLYAHKGSVVFEQAGELHIYNVQSKTSKRVPITIKTDLLELRERFVFGKQYVRSVAISPSGARVVVDFRGDIVTVPAKKGDAKNRTETTGVHEKFPSWSPDGKSIAYFSDASGEYALYIQNNFTKNISRIPLKGAGFYANIHWSPNSKKVAYVDNGRHLFMTDILSKKTTEIAQDVLFTPGDIRDLFASWSHDSNWVSYTIITETNFEQAYLYSISENKSYQLSDGLSNVSEPVFDPSGKYVFMLASTDAGPLVNWFDQSNIDKELTHSIYLVTLRKDIKSPLAKENDEEKIEVPKEESKEKDYKIENLKIDWDGIQERIINLPIEPGVYSSLSLAKEGELYYMVSSFHSRDSKLNKFDFKTRKSEALFPVNAFQIAAGGKKMLYVNKQSWYISDLGKKSKEEPIKLEAISVKINPKAEWTNIFNEAWRVNRDYFYDPGMHGVDWDAMKVKYQPFLQDVSCRSDLYRVMQWMFSELAVGHHRFSNRGDRLNNPQRIRGGLLGANYVVKNNRYQIAKIFGGLNWTPDLRSPLTEPGVDVNQGDYIIAVNGKNIRGIDNIYSFFENTANKIIDLRVSKNANGTEAREVKVTPLETEWAIRNRDWVEGNMRKVDKATNGQVAYVYVPNTTTAGFEYFKRYFYPQAKKKAIIIDERYNGGGSLADYYIDILKKPEQSYWNFRYGKDLKAPSASIQGPKVMIADEMSASGGDYLPWMFKKFKLGPVVGKRTWGGLVGVLGYPEFIDGGIVTAPNVAFYSDNGFRVENEGVAPDIEVEQWPELVIKGHDPQLEKAIEIALKGLKENPPKVMQRPAYPDKTKN